MKKVHLIIMKTFFLKLGALLIVFSLHYCTEGGLNEYVSSLGIVSGIDDVAPGVPASLVATSGGSSQIHLSWDAASDNISSIDQLAYNICYSESSGGCNIFNPSLTTPAGAISYDVTGLTPNTEYFFKIRAVDEEQNIGEASSEASAITSPAGTVNSPFFIPSAGTYGNQQSVILSSATAEANVCYTTDGISTPACSLNAECTTGTTYNSPVDVSSDQIIQAIACKPTFSSSPVVTSVYTIDLAGPTVPGQVTATPEGSSHIDLNWAASIDNTTAQNQLVYNICQSSSAGGCDIFSPTYTVGAGSLIYSVSGLSPLTTYYFKIRAVDSFGNAGASSAEISATTGVAGTVIAPQYNPPSGTYSPIPVIITSSTTNAKICYTTDSSIPECDLSGSCSTGSIFNGSVNVDSIQTLKAIACKAGYTPSAITSATYTIDTVAPTIPNNFSGNAEGSNQIMLSWNASSDNLSPQGQITYEICQGSIPGACNFFTPSYTTEPGTTSYIVTGLNFATTYYFRILAYDLVGNTGIQSGEIYATTNPEGVTNNPVISPASGVYNSVNVTMDSTTTGSSICYTTDGITAPACDLGGSCLTGNTYTGGFTVSTTQVLQAIACKSGFADSGVTSSIFTIDTTGPSSPASPAAATVDATQILLSWYSSTDNYSGQNQIYYEVCQSSTASGCNTFIVNYTTNPGATSFNVTGLSPATWYYFRIRAKDSLGNMGSAGTVVTASTATLGTAIAPTFSLPGGNYTNTSIALQSATSDVLICYSVDGITTPACDSTPICTAGMAYTSAIEVVSTQTIKAIACKNSYTSSPVVSQTYTIIDLAGPTIPGSFAGNANGSTQIELTWTPSTDNVTPQNQIVYEVCQTSTSGGCNTFNANFVTSAGAISYTIGGLEPFSTYYFRIRAKDILENPGQSSVEVSVSTPSPYTVENPTFSPTPGSYNTSQNVAISTATADATICYTLDGALPLCNIDATCLAGLTYSTAIPVSSTTIIKARGCKIDYSDSNVSSGNIIIDTATPVGYTAVIDQPAVNNDNMTNLSFTVSGGEGDAVYSYIISSSGGGTNVTGMGTLVSDTQQISGIDVSGLNDGTLTMSLTLTDAAGNIGAAVISTKDKDTVLPEVTVNPAVTITSSNHVLYSVDGTCSEEGQTVTVTIDTVNALSYCTGGVFTISDIDLTFVPDSVSLLITINHMDAAGNLANQATTTVLKDTTISQPSMPDLAAADDTGLSNSDNITKNTTLLTFSGTADAGDSVQIYKNGFPTGAPIIATGGTYTIDLSLTAGATYSITAKATDSVGNISSVSDVASITIDTIAPAAPSIPDLDPTDDSGAYSTDNITNIYSGATFNGSAENGSSVQLYRSSVALGSPGTATGGVYSISVNLSNGTNSMTAKATDLAGNVSAASSYIYITVDYTAPGLPSVDLNAAYDTGTSSTDNITRVTAVGSTFYFNGSCENNGRVQLYKGGVAYGSLTSPSGTAWSVTVNSADFPDGAYSIQARTTDLAGNTGNISSALSVTFDTVAPAEPISLDLSTASDLGISNADNITSTTAPVITGYGTSGTNIQVYANSVANGATVASTSSWTKTMSLSAGSYTITAKALDVAGNASVDSASIDITIDTGKPTVTAAETMDVDSNGKIDHYKLTLSRDMLDSSFPGYVLNGGNVTTEWKISSRNNVKMRHGSSAPELDTINDNIIYLGFDEFTAPDTGVKPDITTTTAPAFFDYLAGNIIAQQNTITITEADRAKPVITEALSSADTYAKVTFSEIVSAATAEIPSNYLITGLIVNSASMFDSVGLDDNEVVLTTTAQTISTAYDLSVSNIQDLANIVTSAPGNTANFTCTGIHPAPQNVKALNGDTQNTISWEAVPGATGYNVYWSNTAGVTKATGTLISVGNVISYTHTGLTNGTRYYYVVTALGSYSESAESAEVNAVPSKYRQIEAGYNHTVVIKTDGTLWVWGLNSNGQLGDGTITSKSTPTQIGTDTNWASVSSGVSHTLATKTDGTLWAWGYNGYGQLGDGTTIQRLTPTQIGTDTNWASVSSGNSHSMAIKSDGTLWAWGYNGYGQLGDGTTIQKNIPVQIGVDTTWVSISVGGDYTVGIKTDGILWSWGKNNLCQLGDGTSVDKTTPTQIGVNTWASISTGFDYIMGIKTDGTLWGWGYNGYGQLGDGTITSKCTPVQIATDTWTSVAAGGSYAHTVAIKTDGTLWAWGSNYYYQLGDGTASQQNTPVQIGVDTTWVSVAVGSGYTLASKNETLWSWGYNLYGQLGKGTLAPYEPGQIVGATNWSKVSVGYRHTMGLQNDGTLWAWGDNSTAQLGDGTTLYQYNPMKIGMANWLLIDTRAFSSFGIQTDGILWAWGNNAGYQLGTGDSVDRISPTQIGVAAWLSVSAGISHSLGIQSDGTLWAWGDNGSGQLGDGTLVGKSMPTQIGVATWALVSAGSAHTLGIKSDGTLWAWGDNGSGQLGDGTTVSKSFPVQIGTATWASVSASNAHTIGIQTNGRLYAWGNNAYGQLGDGTTVNKSTPTLIGTATWASVSTDWGYTMGIKTDGTLWAWGRNSSGQLGDGTTVQRISPVQIGTATWASISTCPNIFAFTVGTQTDGTLWAWGDNSYGQLGYGRIPEPVLPF